jgi:GNAT superfamily N-acetyltransferase
MVELASFWCDAARADTIRRMTDTHDLARRALDVNQAQFALGNECFEADGGRFVRNAATPEIRDANHVSHVAAASPEAIDALLARVEREFAHAPHRAYQCDFRTPPEFEARLTLDDFTMRTALVSVLEGDLIGEPRPFEIRTVESEHEWRAFDALHALDWRESREKLGQEEAPEVGAAMAHTRRLKCPPSRYYLGYIDGAPRGYFSTLPGIDDMAQVEDLFVEPAYRRRGLATALIHHTVAACRAAGAGPIVIVSEPADTPKHMYAAMGFRPVAVKRDYWKVVG